MRSLSHKKYFPERAGFSFGTLRPADAAAEGLPAAAAGPAGWDGASQSGTDSAARTANGASSWHRGMGSTFMSNVGAEVGDAARGVFDLAAVPRTRADEPTAGPQEAGRSRMTARRRHRGCRSAHRFWQGTPGKNGRAAQLEQCLHVFPFFFFFVLLFPLAEEEVQTAAAAAR